MFSSVIFFGTYSLQLKRLGSDFVCLWLNNWIESEKINTETNITEEVEKKGVDNEVNSKGNGGSSSSSVIPCIDRLREELSCAVRIWNHHNYTLPSSLIGVSNFD